MPVSRVVERTAVVPIILFFLAGCSYTPRTNPASTPTVQYANGQTGTLAYNDRVPDFASRNFTPFNRQDVAAIALREWRLFGMPVADEDPHDRPDPSSPAMKPERLPGLWQRVGEYWWIGQDPGENESHWTGRTDGEGRLFNAVHDGNYAWSAAFISYVMRVAGANDRFPYSPNHSTYINAAASGQNWGITAQNPASYTPKVGDILCVGRGRSRTVTFSMLPTSYGFPAHCGIVVTTGQNAPPFGQELSIVGGNVDDSVALTHVPTDSNGRVSTAEGASYDSRYPWCAILTPHYDATEEPDNGF
ncbi:DUF2272 domain-containing protein [Saccharibacter sp. 17.LH.SD]|uniref:DUF2272 domain-containing protein n=1 Tax=Saccharibacter sp. 17.LH.SD TaxID=2689393 RepID=UPI0013705969|nr:DUF2272 domain-containing protein [Saccharibacter sp. 17.LH.SD]